MPHPPPLLLLLIFASVTLASGDKLVIKNSLRGPFDIVVQCPALRTGVGAPYTATAVLVHRGSEEALPLPAPTPSSYACVVSWEEVSGVVRFTAYSFQRDQARCGGQGRCAVDVRPDGVYLWDNSAKVWILVQRFEPRLHRGGGAK